MLQRTRRLAFVFGGSLLTIIGIALGACSTDNGTTTPLPGQNDSGRPPKDTGGADDEKDDGGENGSKDAGADCADVPKVRANAGVYCFKNAVNASDAGECSVGDKTICCADAKNGTDFVPGQCVAGEVDPNGGYKSGACAFPAPDAGGREWHCTSKEHCPNSGESCCVIKGTKGPPKAISDTKDYPGCGTFYNSDPGTNVGGSRCRADGCEAGELTLCTQDSDCKTGSCQFFKLAGRYTGVCQ